MAPVQNANNIALVEALQRKPVLEITELTEDTLKFKLTQCDASVANALRRVMIAEVPTLAITFVNIEINSSVLDDEFLSHRLGLIPLRAQKPMSEYRDYRDCPCDNGCPRCTVTFKMDVECSSDIEILKVTSKDLLCTEGDDVEPAHFSSVEEAEHMGDEGGIRVVSLGAGQRVKLEAIAHVGTGKEHAKWNPTCVATYQYEPIIDINHSKMDDLSPEKLQSIVKSCPTGVFSLNEADKFVVSNPLACMFCMECEEASALNHESEPLVQVEHNLEVFHFSVESTGALAPEEIVFSAFDVVLQKLDVFQQELYRINSESETHQEADANNNVPDINSGF